MHPSAHKTSVQHRGARSEEILNKKSSFKFCLKKKKETHVCAFEIMIQIKLLIQAGKYVKMSILMVKKDYE